MAGAGTVDKHRQTHRTKSLTLCTTHTHEYLFRFVLFQAEKDEATKKAARAKAKADRALPAKKIRSRSKAKFSKPRKR